MELKTIDQIFQNRIFRIPDYQRGYAWRSDGNKEVVAFWNDLMNLSENQKHFTGTLTLQEIPHHEKNSVLGYDSWLTEYGYEPWFVIDGQQRLTTIIILIQSLFEFLNCKTEIQSFNTKRRDKALEDLREKYICRTNEDGINIRSYLFGYDNNDTSDNFLKRKILGDENIVCSEESYYTLNMINVKLFFKREIEDLYKNHGEKAIKDLLKKVTQQLRFDLIEVNQKDDFNIFVAFETINNRGKQLSNLEKLKNRLIYLTSYCGSTDTNNSDSKNSVIVKKIRNQINDSWKEIYRQLGRNTKSNTKGKISVLDDDEFLKTHWILFYQYSRKTGHDYISFLLDTKFTVQNVLEKLAAPEISQETEYDEEDEIIEEMTVDSGSNDENKNQKIGLSEINDYVVNLQNTAKPWYYTHFPQDSTDFELSIEIKKSMERINRIGIVYFRPLITALFYRIIVKRDINFEDGKKLLDAIERFIFLEFRLQSTRSNYGSSEFNRIARFLHNGSKNINAILELLDDRIAHSFETDENGNKFFKAENMQFMVNKLFEQNDNERVGYYRWPALHYFLFEYENELLKKHHGREVSWNAFKQNENDKISIEHIFPHKAEEIIYWNEKFKDIPKKYWSVYQGSLGNMLLLSQKINASLQNKDYPSKKVGDQDRPGYKKGSCSEINICEQFQEWTPKAIENRGMEMLEFMENRWNFKFKSIEEKKKLLLPFNKF